MCWWFVAGVAVTLLLVLALVLPLRLTSNTVRDNEHNHHVFAPTDTAIIAFTHPFCERLSLASPDSEFFVMATLYLLEQMPTLGREEKASFYREAKLVRNYQYWRMFLYPGSSIDYSACSASAITDPPVVFYLVKGNTDYEIWRLDHSSAHIHREEINVACGSNNVTFSYAVESEDNYYFIIDSEAAATESVTAIFFDSTRVLYDVSINSSVASECSILLNDSTSCQVSLSLSSKPVALLELTSLVPDPFDWDADVRVSISCSARVWLYVVISFSAIAFVGLLALTTILLYLCFCRNKKGRSPPTQDISHSEETHLISEQQKNTSFEAPPPPYKPE